MEGPAWRIKDRGGEMNLKQDGRPTREASLMSGTEITIAGRTFIAESARSIALRNFCSRLIGWDDDRISMVDHALRAIRLASTGRTPLILTGSGDLVPVAHAIHRYALDEDAPFVVSDPHRRTLPATVRSPENCRSCVEALRRAFGGTLCIRARRLPQDFGKVLRMYREPASSAQLMICSRPTLLPSAAQIDIPPLESRCSDLRRIVSEYIDDAIHALRAPDGCLDAREIEWIVDQATFGNMLTMSNIEKAAFRVVALKVTGNLSRGAELLEMAPVSLGRWIRRRGGHLPGSSDGAYRE
jgi:hypothetical protein